MALIDLSPFSDFGWGPFWTAFWNTLWRFWCVAGWIIPAMAWVSGAYVGAAASALTLAVAVLVIRRVRY